jgi:hypothetical protein
METAKIARECSHRHCEKRKFRRGVCSKHYWELRGGRPDAVNSPAPKQHPLLVREWQEIARDKEGLWEFVKSELQITGNKIEAWHKVPK